MRFDKFTTKLQQALADAQSLALSNDNGFVEPVHLLASLLTQDDAGTASLLSRAGVNVPALKVATEKAIARLPKVEGQGGEISVSRGSSLSRRMRHLKSRTAPALFNCRMISAWSV